MNHAAQINDRPRSAADDLGLVAELMGMGHTVENALALVGPETRMARLAAIIAEVGGTQIQECDGPRWLRESAPTIAQVIDAGCLAWRCAGCSGSGRVYVALCGECGGDGARRLPASAIWSKGEWSRTAVLAGFELHSAIIRLAPVEVVRFEWSVKGGPDGWGVNGTARVRVRPKEPRSEAEARALLCGMLEAEKAVRSEARS